MPLVCYVPGVTKVTPSQGATQGSKTLVISGTNLTGRLATSVVFPKVELRQIPTVAGLPCSVSAATDAQVTCTLGPGVGGGYQVWVETTWTLGAPVNVSGISPSNVVFSFTNLPIITGIGSTSGFPTAGGNLIQIAGINFGSTAGSVAVGGINCPVVSQSDTLISCALPPGVGANVPVFVTTAGQTSSPFAFNYDPPVVTTVVSPAGGFPTSGARSIQIVGTNFGATSAVVTVGGSNCPLLSQSHIAITCVLPAGEGLNVPLQVTTAGQPSNVYALNYDAPVLTTINPSTAAPGSSLVVSGSNFGTHGVVNIGPLPCTTTATSQTQITCTVPNGEGVGHAVRVTVSGQLSGAAQFNYPAPVITSASPAAMSVAGGVPITLSGSGFGPSSTVTIGATPITSFTSLSYNAIVFTMPALGVYGPVPIVVTDAGQVSNAYSYRFAPPLINVVSPSVITGGDSLTVTGESFAPDAIVTVGGNVCVITARSSTSFTCTVPTGSGFSVPVVVTSGTVSSNVFIVSYAGNAIVPLPTWAMVALAAGLVASLRRLRSGRS